MRTSPCVDLVIIIIPGHAGRIHPTAARYSIARLNDFVFEGETRDKQAEIAESVPGFAKIVAVHSMVGEDIELAWCT
jgi:hypothetical protein